MISSIRVRTDTIDYLLEAGDEGKLRKVVNEITEIADDAYESLREEILGLRGTLKGKGIVLTITEHLKRLERQWGIKTQFELLNEKNEMVIPARVELQILRIFQEAVTNVRRHAQANQIDVILKENNEFVQLEIADDGQGFELDGIRDEKARWASDHARASRKHRRKYHNQILSRKRTRLVVKLPLKSEYYL